MSRPLLELADLIRTAGTAFIERNRQWIRWPHLKVLLAIARCRTAALGGHIDECSRCGQRATISYNSCRFSECPSDTLDNGDCVRYSPCFVEGGTPLVWASDVSALSEARLDNTLGEKQRVGARVLTPMSVHDGVPPGATTMKLLKAKIQYRYEEIPTGGNMRIESKDPVALAAILNFLRFQITEHGTGDSL